MNSDYNENFRINKLKYVLHKGVKIFIIKIY